MMKNRINRTLLFIYSFIFVLFCFTGCGDPDKKLKEDYAKVKVDGLRLEILDPLENRLDGLGTEWDPYLLTPTNMQNGNLSSANRATEDDFTFVCNRALQMGLQKVRVMLQPAWIEPQNDNNDPFVTDETKFDWENPYSKMFLKILDFCEENGIKVNVTTWCANTDNNYFMGMNSGQWCSAPRDLDEYVENIVYSTKYLIKTKKYTCVTEICPFNEPNWAFLNDNKAVDFERFVQLCKKLDERLKAEGLRDKIKLNLSDANNFNDSKYLMEEMKDIADIFNTHCYDFYSHTSPDIFYDYSKALANHAKNNGGAIHVLGEFGFRTTIGSHGASDIDTYERGLGIAKMVVNVLNGGTVGVSYWCLFDQFYDMGSQRMEVGLWKYKDQEWQARPQFYSYSLLTKYTAVGAEIYPITSEDEAISAIAFKNTDGSWTYVAVNDSNEAKSFSFTNSNLRNLSMNKYLFSEDTLPANGMPITSLGKKDMKEFVLSDTLPPKSMAVYSSKR